MRVCLLSVCPRAYLQNCIPCLHHYLIPVTLPIVVAWSSSGGVSIRCVLPVLWMTPYLHIILRRIWPCGKGVTPQVAAPGAESAVYTTDCHAVVADDGSADGWLAAGVEQWFAGGERGVHGGQWNVRLYGREQRRTAPHRAASARHQYVSIQSTGVLLMPLMRQRSASADQHLPCSQELGSSRF